VNAIDDSFVGHISKWIKDDARVEVNFPDNTAKIIDNMIKQYAKPGSILA